MWIRKTYSTGEETKFNERDAKVIIDAMFEAIDNKEITPDEYFEGEYCISDDQTPEDALAEEIINNLMDIMKYADTYRQIADLDKSLWWNIHYRYGNEMPDSMKTILDSTYWKENE